MWVLFVVVVVFIFIKSLNFNEKLFLRACENGDIQYVENALNRNKNLANIKCIGDISVLSYIYNPPHIRHYTSGTTFIPNGHLATILINHGADINMKCGQRISVLHWASYHKHDAVVELLINKGADVNARDCYERTPLMFAGNENIVQLLINNGADVNAKNCKGETALMNAVESELFAVAKSLIENGADVNAVSYNNDTALILAIAKGNSDIAKLLGAHGAL